MAVTVLNAVDQGRLHAPAAIGEHRIGRDHPHHRGLAGAERIGQIVRQFVIDAEALGVFADQGHADVLRQPHRHRVERQPQRVAQRRRTMIFAGRIVLRAPDAGALPLIDLDRRIDHHRRRRIAVVERRRVHDRLERGPRLPVGLRGAVELALVEREAADHRQHAAGPWDPSPPSRRKLPAAGAADTGPRRWRHPCRSADRHRSRRRALSTCETAVGVLPRAGPAAAFAHFTPSSVMFPVCRSLSTAPPSSRPG